MIAVAVLVLAIFIVGGILLYMLITTLTLEETTNISAVSQGPAVVNGKELSDYLGLTAVSYTHLSSRPHRPARSPHPYPAATG